MSTLLAALTLAASTTIGGVNVPNTEMQPVSYVYSECRTVYAKLHHNPGRWWHNFNDVVNGIDSLDGITRDSDARGRAKSNFTRDLLLGKVDKWDRVNACSKSFEAMTMALVNNM
jgi:hypothetical protein